jgi:hypothetical protein
MRPNSQLNTNSPVVDSIFECGIIDSFYSGPRRYIRTSELLIEIFILKMKPKGVCTGFPHRSGIAGTFDIACLNLQRNQIPLCQIETSFLISHSMAISWFGSLFWEKIFHTSSPLIRDVFRRLILQVAVIEKNMIVFAILTDDMARRALSCPTQIHALHFSNPLTGV